MSYPPPMAPLPGSAPRLRGRTPLRLAIIFLAVAVIAIVSGIVIVVKGTFEAVDDFQRVSISAGTGTVDFSGTGTYVAYYEAPGVNDNITALPELRLGLRSVTTGTVLDIERYRALSNGETSKLTYDYDGHQGVALAQFDVPTAGRYQVAVEAVSGVAATADIAFGRDILGKSAVAGGLLIFGGALLLIAGIVLLIVGLVKRSRSKREIAAAQAGGYGPPPGYGQPYPYPQQYPYPPPQPQQNPYPQQPYQPPQQGFSPPGHGGNQDPPSLRKDEG